MPTLDKLIKRRKITLPVSGMNVEIGITLTSADERALRGIEDQNERQDEMAFRCIKSWDLTDDAGVVLPVTRESFDQMSNLDATEIFSKFIESVVAIRKSSGIDAHFDEAQKASESIQKEEPAALAEEPPVPAEQEMEILPPTEE